MADNLLSRCATAHALTQESTRLLGRLAQQATQLGLVSEPEVFILLVCAALFTAPPAPGGRTWPTFQPPPF